VSGTVSPGQAKGRRAGAAAPPEAGGRRHGGRRRWLAAGVVVVVLAAGVVVAGVAGVFSTSSSPGAGAAGSSYRTSAAVVVRRSLSSQTQVSATLGFAGSYSVTGQGTGTLTWLPAEGRVIREGQVLYRVDNGTPVFLLYGKVPAWRDLAVGLTGADVGQLNRALVRLGYATRGELLAAGLGMDYFSSATAAALEGLQAHLGLPATGSLPLGQAAFLPTALRVTKPGSLGAAASGTVLTGTSARQVVTINLDAAQQGEVKAGDKVTITLPDGATTPGVVASVGKVAKGSGSSATITVLVALTDPKTAGRLDQAPVTVAITTARVSNVLVVPVAALLSRPKGGYAVEVTGPGGHHLVPVQVGLFDDAAGLVQVSGAGLAAGQHVVVPAL
jgi:multidrug efflux pump subunit AcrA (membrane-fusion protein)